MGPTFVVAGNHKEFLWYCKSNNINYHDPFYIYLSEGNAFIQLAGMINPDVIFCGSFYNRKDLNDIKSIIISRSISHENEEGQWIHIL